MTDPTTGAPDEVPGADYAEQHTDAVPSVTDPEQPISTPDPATAVAQGDPEADPADVAEQATPVVAGEDPAGEDGYPPAG